MKTSLEWKSAFFSYDNNQKMQQQTCKNSQESLDLGKNTLKSKRESTRLKENWHYLTLPVPLSFSEMKDADGCTEGTCSVRTGSVSSHQNVQVLGRLLKLPKKRPCWWMWQHMGKMCSFQMVTGKRVGFGNSDCLRSSKNHCLLMVFCSSTPNRFG